MAKKLKRNKSDVKNGSDIVDEKNVSKVINTIFTQILSFILCKFLKKEIID